MPISEEEIEAAALHREEAELDLQPTGLCPHPGRGGGLPPTSQALGWIGSFPL